MIQYWKINIPQTLLFVGWLNVRLSDAIPGYGISDSRDTVFLPPSVIQSTTRQFSRLADLVISKKVLDWVGDAERNVPYVRGRESPARVRPFESILGGG